MRSYTRTLRSSLFVLPLVVLTAIVGCAGEDSVDDSADDDLTKTATGVSLEYDDDGAVFSVEESKKIVVNLSYGGFTMHPHGKWGVKTSDISAPKITTKANPNVPDMPIHEKLEWKVPTAAAAGTGKHTIVLTAPAEGNSSIKYTFSFKVTKKSPTLAKEGQTCGGIAGLICADGLDCKYTSSGPDAAGKCRKRFVGRQAGEMCGGIAALRCAEGLVCKFSGPRHPDQSGTCVIDN